MQERNDLYFQLFDFYISMNNEKKASELLNQINTLEDSKLKEHANMIYSILLKKEDCYLKELLDRVEKEGTYEKAFMEYLIAEIYKNQKNENREATYRKRSITHFHELSRIENE